MKRTLIAVSFLILLGLPLAAQRLSSKVENSGGPEIRPFLELVNPKSESTADEALATIDRNWVTAYEIMVLELIYLSKDDGLSLKLLLLLQTKTGKQFGYDFDAWYDLTWNRPQELLTDYHVFKARLYSAIDSRFSNYFLDRQETSLIRFDEIRWGGVMQDGIPPLRNPKMIAAGEASYLDDDNIVFGIAVNGDFRAYPKRILAWHELFTDEVGGEPVAGVYCTLCGTVILYKTTHAGVVYDLGTSGFLYRSNKLMYDQKTQSLWSTLEGKPVVGPLVGQDIQLEYGSVVTTTWGEWKTLHPETKVLDINTGFRRNYGEGEAYKDYFASDELMFGVPTLDKKLKNKQPILAIRLPESSERPLAISTKFLKKNPIYHDAIGDTRFVVLTDKSGANRVYKSGSLRFEKYTGGATAMDDTGTVWTIHEDRLETTSGETLPRLETFNAFWFGWQAAFPSTRLVK